MEDNKTFQTFSVEPLHDNGSGSSNAEGLPQSVEADAYDMHRMGKKQVLRREFKFITIVGFVCILQSTWESALLSGQYALYNGGTGGAIWTTIAVWCFVMCMIASMAEMASMAPTAGGQYHWVSEFAPRSYEKPLSYIVGWCCCLGWISGVPACGQFLASMVEGLILLIYPDTTFGSLWQTTLIIYFFLFATFAFNIFLSHKLPLAEGIILIVHVLAFFAFLIVLWVMGTKSSAYDTFFTFENGGGWSSTGVSCLVGLATPLWMFLGPDAGAHMSEELKDASVTLPRAMMLGTLLNGILGILMMITFCFTLGSVDDVLNSPTGYPIIQVLYNVTGSNTATIILTSILILLTYFASISTIASASRQAWAFARDQGFPFSNWISYVRPGQDYPLNALLMVLAVSLVLASINFGSDLALGAIVSVSNAALIFSYIISIGCLRLLRLRGQPLLPRRWSLGRWGGPINDVALAFLSVSFVFSFFPTDVRPDAPDMNWAIVMFAAVCIIAGVYYGVAGRKRYVSPRSLVKTM